MKKGIFITFYGINNIGKSTQARRLVERLKRLGYDAVFVKYPIYDLPPTGPKLNQILREHKGETIPENQLQTLFFENRLEFEPQLKKMLAEGKIVVAEDYTGTGIAWGKAKGLDQAWIEKINKNLLREDLPILLRGKRHVSAREENHIHEQDDELVEKVNAILLQLAKKFDWKVLEIHGSIEEVEEEIWEVVEKFIKS